jgi:WD40 repeat protein
MLCVAPSPAQRNMQSTCCLHPLPNPENRPSCCLQSWLDHNNVLVGTKCNKLRQLHVPSRTWQDVPYPEQPVHRQGPDLLASINRSHCGQHGLAVSPSGAYCVTGGTAAEDILLWRLQDGSGPSNMAGMQPVQTFMGHTDWVFDVDWLSDRHWVSGSRDGTIKLWQVPEAAAGSSYSTDPGSALLSVGFHGVSWCWSLLSGSPLCWSWCAGRWLPGATHLSS